jgi:hypothetical protein
MQKMALPFVALIMIAFASIILPGCGRTDKKAEQKNADTNQSAITQSDKAGTVGGISWNIPAGWSLGPDNPMRVATYTINPVEGDQDKAECGVFFFEGGKGGGGVQANLDRWIGQIEQPDGKTSSAVAKTNSLKVNGLTITTVELGGIYRMTAGPMMQVKEKKPGYYLIAAIIEGPQGPVFFKMVGPEKTMIAGMKDFLMMLNSVKSRGEV